MLSKKDRLLGNDSETNLNGFLKWVPHLGAVFIIISGYGLNSYYRSFNVEIFNYIDFSDILSLFFTKLFYILFFLVVIFFGFTKNFTKNRVLKSIFFIFSLTFILSYIFGLVEKKRVLKEYKYYSTSVTMKDSTAIKSDSITSFIGNTSEYIFFYNKINSEALIIPFDEVKSFRLRRKKYWFSIY